MTILSPTHTHTPTHIRRCICTLITEQGGRQLSGLRGCDNRGDFLFFSFTHDPLTPAGFQCHDVRVTEHCPEQDRAQPFSVYSAEGKRPFAQKPAAGNNFSTALKTANIFNNHLYLL